MLNKSATLSICNEVVAGKKSFPDNRNTILSLNANVPTITGTAKVINEFNIVDAVSEYSLLFPIPI